ncbi:bifunctional pyr operon transcriptional regulator/uracil phosphoribosyltransferase PyrR [Belliella kenyensis]|uniref:Bifunctional pyr operon transcriptional regulator/uracil phosphoribosyltransferase PyrR n=2 Tax=Belliella TaxID=232244 RepID=A0ABS9V0M0_9BACT|nr:MULTISPECIES: bifunctional pyr operon transcriptional regulator/uracil phosphoribosyltransferase PyrR [Belliella]MCH7400930.1 bifunctional pyr operon transcriptional regulator/uracil phosphoribosyltransferase PyrR [Belliella kenyensis]MCH7409873.1 bifunctional pyr operon transcriptional regulator/uracil phosphoribosyltransferase PyrR [Belliella filtrata]MDN3603929.1 bifunctional pyr operon transcriptional regulator/uracil phosphoribosyltransferase PyrR [Belliella kenyensis]
MQKRLVLDQRQIEIILKRFCHQLIENHDTFENTVLLGLQPRGPIVLDKIAAKLKEITGLDIPFGYLDATFHRDDFRRRDFPLKANETKINFLIEGKRVVLVDDVLYKGRSVRAAMDAMIAFGRPAKVELMVLVDRKFTRDYPIMPDYCGLKVNTLESQYVIVEWAANGFENDGIWITEKEKN